MAVKDIRSNLQETLAFFTTITGDGVDNGVSLNTADFELGLMFSVTTTEFGTGTFEMTLEQSSDSTFATGVTTISGDQLIGTIPTITGANSAGDILQTVGVISNLQFVRAVVTTSGTATGDTTIVIVATQKAENMPVV